MNIWQWLDACIDIHNDLHKDLPDLTEAIELGIAGVIGLMASQLTSTGYESAMIIGGSLFFVKNVVLRHMNKYKKTIRKLANQSD